MKVPLVWTLALALVLATGFGIAGLAWAQPAAPAHVQISAPGAAGVLSVTRVNDETLVSVKDHGSSQTVIVYKIDEKGTARLTHKAKFFY